MYSHDRTPVLPIFPAHLEFGISFNQCEVCVNHGPRVSLLHHRSSISFFPPTLIMLKVIGGYESDRSDSDRSGTFCCCTI